MLQSIIGGSGNSGTPEGLVRSKNGLYSVSVGTVDARLLKIKGERV